MEISEWIAVVSVLIALVSLAVHLRLNLKQNRANALIEIYANNRDILSMGFERPELLEILSNDPKVDLPRHYLQMWFNQISLIFQLQSQNAFTPEQWQALEVEIHDFMTNPATREHWQPRRNFYPADFRSFIDQSIQEAEDKKNATTPLPESPPA